VVRLLRSLALATLALWVASVHAAPQKGTVALGELGVGQDRVGVAASNLYFPYWRDNAAEKKITLSRYARDVLAPEIAKERAEVFRDWKGKLRLTDGHHRARARLKLAKLAKLGFSIRYRVSHDYSGWSEEAYAHDVIRRGLIYVGPRDGRTDVEMVRSLPEVPDGMKNDPLRSAMDAAFDRLGLSGRQFERFVEFHGDDRLIERGLYRRLHEAGLIEQDQRTLPAKLALDPRVTDVIVEMMREKPMRKYLLGKTISDRARREVNKALRED
jgi:hypothetical protein